jgi:hypothetical protein
MVLVTKFDALYDVAYAELKLKGASMEEAEELAPKHAETRRKVICNWATIELSIPLPGHSTPSKMPCMPPQ